MSHKSREELKNDFRRDYTSAVSFYNENDFIHFNRDIRPSIEHFSRLILFDLIGEDDYHKIEENLNFVGAHGELLPQKSDSKVTGSGWVINAKNAFMRMKPFQYTDAASITLKRKIFSSLDQLQAQYNEASETSQHSGAVEDSDRLREQADLCVTVFIALLQPISNFISEDLNTFFSNLPLPDKNRKEESVTPGLIEKENFLLKLDELALRFQRQGGLKFIAFVPDRLSESLHSSRFSDFFRVKWSLVVDFDPNDTGDDSLRSFAPSKSIHILSDENCDVTDGSDLTGWMFARGRKSLKVLSKTELLRNFPSQFKRVFGQMVKAGTTDDYVIISFCGSQEVGVLLKAFDKLEDVFGGWDSVEKRCRIACLSKSNEVLDDVSIWGNEIGLTPLVISADLNDFIKHLDQILPYSDLSKTDNHQYICGKSLDITEDVTRYKAAGIDFFGPMMDCNQSPLWDFYSGADITWNELENDCDAKRDCYRLILSCVKDIIKSNRNTAREFILKHRPGSGGTTLARRLAYDIYKDDEANLLSCIVVLLKKCDNVNVTFDYLSKLSQDTGNVCILAIVESKNVGRRDFDRLIHKLALAKKSIVFFYLESCPGALPNVGQRNAGFLDDMLNADEPRFIAKYKSLGIDMASLAKVKSSRRRQSLEVIDFPLLLKDNLSSNSLSSYVSGWMSILPQNLKKFVGYVGFVGYYSELGLNQNLVKSTWFDPKQGHHTLKGYSPDIQNVLYKLLIEEYSDDEALGIWRPRYNKFSLFIIKGAWGENWKTRLSEISKQFINDCATSGQLGFEDKDMLYSLFVIRKNIDFRVENIGHKNRFALLISDLDDQERTVSLFKTLVSTYPDDAVFRGHYARFLYEMASSAGNVNSSDMLFQEAQKQLDLAFEINPHDADLYHMQGMLIRRQMSSFKKEYKKQETEVSSYKEKAESQIADWVQRALGAFDQNIQYDPSSPYGYAASCQLLQEAIEFIKVILEKKDYSFCEKYPYAEYVAELGEKLDDFEQVCYAFKDYTLSQVAPSLKIYHTVRLFHKNIIGCSRRVIDKYRALYQQSTGDLHSMYGDFLIKSILYAKTESDDYRMVYSLLNNNEINEIEKILQLKRDSGDLKSYDTLFKLYRYGKKQYDIDDAIDLLRDCEAAYKTSGNIGWGYLNACFYLAVCYSIRAIQNDTLNSELVSNANDYFSKAAEMASLFDRSAINALCFMGRNSDIHAIVDRESDGIEVSGVVNNIDNNKGIMKLKCGLEASFNAKSMDRFKYQGKIVKGVIGFKYRGLGLYQFSEIEEDPEISNEEKEEIINNSYFSVYDEDDDIDFSDEEDSVSDYSSENVRTCTGIYRQKENVVQCKDFSYMLTARSKMDDDIYDGADVLFEVGSEPNRKDPLKTYYFAKNIRFKE